MVSKRNTITRDNFTAQKDYFNAKHSVKSILDNYDGYKDEILAEAVQKIEYIQNLELNEMQEQPEQEELEIELETMDENLENTPKVLNSRKLIQRKSRKMKINKLQILLFFHFNIEF